MKVYLAGPITGLTLVDAQDWRSYARKRLKEHSQDIEGFSPLRAKDYLLDRGVLSGHPDAYADRVLSSAKGILSRDRWDVMTCDAVLVNFIGAQAVSIGTVMEIAYADAFRKPCIVAMEEGNLHHHAMLDTSVGWICDGLDLAIDVTAAILLPDGVGGVA